MKINQFGAIWCSKNKYQKVVFLMKLSFFFYIICCFQLIALNGFSQKKVTLNAENTSLESIMVQIENQTQYSFIFNNDVIDVNRTFNIKVLKEDIEKTIDLLFKSSGISYKIKKNLIILSSNRSVDFTVSGLVVDAETGETLFGANVIVKSLKKGTTTNEYGFYSVTLPEGKYVLEITYLGYTKKEVSLDLKENINKKIELQSSLNELDEVVVTSNEKNKSQVASIITGSTKITSTEIKKLPSLLGEPDITRALLTQAGISTTREGSTGFNARGGNIDQNLVLLDEAPLYNSSHLFGLFSIFNADAVKDVTLFKGGIPARFGGRGSSVLDIHQKNGNSKSFKGQGGLGLLFSRLTLEGPIVKDKVSFLLSGRRSYFDLFFPLIKGAEGTQFYFYDLNTKLSWNINENNTLYASGFFGADVIGSEQESDEGESESNLDSNWSNATTTIRWNHIFSNKLFANFTGIYSKYNFTIGYEESVGELTNESVKRSIDNFIFKSDFTYYQNPSTKMRFGLNTTLYKFIPGEISSTLTDLKLDTEEALELAAYYSIEKEWNKFSLQAGLRYSWFANLGPGDVTLYNPNFPLTPATVTGTENYSKNEIIKQYGGLEPRLSLKYDVNDRKAFKLGYNRIFQYIHLLSNASSSLPFDQWKPSGTYIEPLEVNQFSAGYAYDSKTSAYNFSTEAYFKTFDNIVEYKNGASTIGLSNTLETELVPAKGFAYGLELTAHKNSGKLTGNVNYTYSVARRKTVSAFSSDRINDGAYFPSNFDRPHMFNITANYELSKKWTIGTFFTYQSGGPTTQPNGRLIFNGEPFLTYSDRNAFRVSDTHRMDVSFTYTPDDNPKTKWEGSWNFGIYNVYGNNNAFATRSKFDNGRLRILETSFIVAPIPFITYNFKF